MDAQVKLKREVCAWDMEQRRSNAALKQLRISHAAVKGAKHKLGLEEYVGRMGRWNASDAVLKDVQIYLKRGECAPGMGRRIDYAAVKDLQIKSSREECVRGTEEAMQYEWMH